MPVLEVVKLNKFFGKNHVLKDVSFSLEEGQVLSIIGTSGSGKTTVLRCINQLETADSGFISVDGHVFFDESSKKESAEKKRQKQLLVGLIFQDFNLFPQYTALENITLAPTLRAKEKPDYKKNKKEILEAIDARARELLDQVGLADKADFYPCQLSGGQKQRVSIARALILDPAVLFFDEPTSALDPELTGEILRVIKSLAAENTTMVIVTHEMKFAREVSDRIVFMEHGTVAYEGTPEELFSPNAPERIKAFIGKLSE